MPYTVEVGSLSFAVSSPASGMFLTGWFQYFYPRAPIWQDTPPEDVGIGQEIGIHVRYMNTASVDQDMAAYVYVYDPDGIEIARKEPTPRGIVAGGNYGTILTTKNTTKLGAYTALSILYADGQMVDQWEGLVAGTIEEEVDGDFIDNMFRYWNDETGEWEEDPPIQISASCVGIYTSGRNTGTSIQKMTTDVAIKDPSGKTIKTAKPSAINVEPTGFVHADVSTYDLTTSGSYSAVCKLIADGQIVDTWSGEIASIEVEEGPPDYQLIQHTIYPWAYVFEGDAERCTFEFKLTPEQIPGTEWIGERIVNAFVDELQKEGSRLLELKVYEDITPTFWTNYRVEVTATASPIVWAVVVYAVLAILILVAVIFTIKAVDDFVHHRKPLSEETKRTFSRETVTAMILELSPETPPETLAAMSDQELRDLLNNRLAEEAAVGIPWKWIAIGGGAALLLAGAVALITRR